LCSISAIMAVSGGGQPRGGDAVRVWRHRRRAGV